MFFTGQARRIPVLMNFNGTQRIFLKIDPMSICIQMNEWISQPASFLLLFRDCLWSIYSYLLVTSSEDTFESFFQYNNYMVITIPIIPLSNIEEVRGYYHSYYPPQQH